MNTIDNIGSLLNFSKLRSLLSFGVKGYLTEIGWFNSFRSKSPVDAGNNPLPWVTYSFINFIEERLNKQLSIFEFGSGNSTLYYAQRTKKVISVEHNKEWLEKISTKSPKNASLIFCELDKNGKYSKAPLFTKEKFDIIIVDGRDRVNCCKNAIDALEDSGVIVLDDSERTIYLDAITFLKDNGFRQLSFSGISPGLFYLKATSVFYKPNNCLDI